jgi:peptidoglycan/xylan/chitin deacetylase (PgdA/CDA1 family)
VSVRDRIRRELHRRRPCVGVILLYHRIASPPRDTWSLSVGPDNFAEHLDVLRSAFAPVPLGDIARRRRRAGPRTPVAVTFDDGYRDNLSVALPILDRYDVPATMFVVTPGQPDFWWDELESLVLDTPADRGVLRIDTPDGPLHLDPGRAPDDDGERGIRAPTTPPPAQHQSHMTAWRALRRMSDDARTNAMDAIRDWAGRPARAVTRMNADEVARLAAHPLADVGGHTSTHPVLAGLSTAAQQDEVHGNARALGAITGRAPTAFSYPFGRPGDYDRQSREAVRSAGFRLACCNHGDGVTPWNDPFDLPRIYVHDVGGAELERRLARWR